MSTRLLIDHRDGPRHPEKVHRPDHPIARKPDWIRVRAPNHPTYHETRALMRANNSSPSARKPPAPTSASAGRSATPR